MTKLANSSGCVADRLLNTVLQTVQTTYTHELDKLYITGLKCQDPETASVGRGRRNFWLWLCEEYPVKNNGIIWLDLQPDVAPTWVRFVLDKIGEQYPGCVEITFTVKW